MERIERPKCAIGGTTGGSIIIGLARRRWGLVVIYDADCAFCALCVRIMQAADLLQLVTYMPGYFESGQRIQSVLLDAQMREGMDVMVQIAGRSPLLWPLLPFLVLGRLLFGQGIYDSVATRRSRIMGGTCRRRGA